MHRLDQLALAAGLLCLAPAAPAAAPDASSSASVTPHAAATTVRGSLMAQP